MPIFDQSQTRVTERAEASVVIPSYQAARHIRRVLGSLLAQHTDTKYEIIVIDSSTDGTDRIIAEEFPQVRVLHFEQRYNVGMARNIGIEAAEADIILFADADTIPCATWIDQMCTAIRRGADAVGGSIVNGTPWSITGSVAFYLEFFRFLGYNGQPRPARYLVGGNSGFRRAVLEGIGYLDHSVGEDMVFSSSLSRQRKKVLFLPRASMKHMNRTGFLTVLRYQHTLGGGAFLYRSISSPKRVRILHAAPPLILLAPSAIMIWIGSSMLRRRLWADFLRFVTSLPISLVANLSWALGFYRALRRSSRGREIVEATHLASSGRQ
jgi:glycosyltransferase involved in cell wall biosynthesis